MVQSIILTIILNCICTLEITNLNVSIDGQPILKDFSLTIPKGEIHALMGPNGTGKSTLAKVIAGHEDYEVTSGEILINGESILGKEADEIKLSVSSSFSIPARDSRCEYR